MKRYLVLKMGQALVGIESQRVLEAVSASNMLESQFKEMAGFVEWRGKHVAVIKPQTLGFKDVQVKLVAVVEVHGSQVGFPASGAVGIKALEEKDIQKPSPGMPDWVLGVYEDVMIADLEASVRPAQIARALAHNKKEFLSFCAQSLSQQDEPELREASQLIKKVLSKLEQEETR